MHNATETCRGHDHLTRDELDADALAALANLDDHAREHIPLMLKFGEALSNAKAFFKHPGFNPWCRDVLKRLPTWSSSYLRLYEDRADLESALAWAEATDHPLASGRSLERLLRIVADYKAATHGNNAIVRRGRRGAKPTTLRAAKTMIAELREALEEAEVDFIALRDPLPADVAAKAAELAALAAADDVAAKDELEALALRYHWRWRDLVAENRPHSEAAHPSPAATDAADEGSAS